ncbi:hypothetical protein SprV_0200762000 [Sparganum proliferum]
MGKVEKARLQDTINGLVFYGRYVDDIFCLADGTTDTEDLVQKFNSAHPSLKFTAEVEAGNEIAFLDVLLHRQEDGSIQRRVSRKKTWTGQYVNFHSFVPLNIKGNLVQGLAARVRRICSPEAIEEELQHLRNTLRENGYPDRFILRNVGERAEKPTVATAEKKELFIRLPFAGDAESELVRRRLTTAITRAFPAANLRALVPMYTSTLLRFHHRSPATARTSITPPALPPPSESTSTTTTAAATTTTTARCIAGFRLICITARRLAQHPLHSHPPQPSSADVMTTKDGHRDGH